MSQEFKSLKKLIFIPKTSQDDLTWIKNSTAASSVENVGLKIDRLESSTTNHLVHSGMISSNIPRLISVGPQYQQESSLNLIYEFDDGIQVDIFNILFHPYGQFIPRDLLPLKTAYTDLKKYAFEKSRDERYMEFYASVMNVLKKAFFIIRLRGENKPYDIFTYFSTSLTNQEERYSFQVSNLDFLHSGREGKNKFALNVEKDEVSQVFQVQLQWPEQPCLIQKNFLFNFNTGVLSFHEFYPELIQFLGYSTVNPATESEQEQTDVPEYNFQKKIKYSSLDPKWDIIYLKSAEEIESVYHELPQLNLPFERLHQKLPRYHIDFEHTFAEIHFNDNADFRLNITGIKDKDTFSFSGFTTPFQTIFDTIAESLKDYVRPSFHKTRMYKDKFIQKVLNHKGLNLYFHYEVVMFLFQNKNTPLTGEQKAQLLRKVCHQMINIISRSARESATVEGEAKQRYEKYLTQLLNSYFDHITDTFFNNVIIFDEDQIFEFEKSGEILFSCLLIYLEAIIKLTDGDCFVRPSKTVYKNLSSQENFKIRRMDNEERFNKEKEHLNFVDNNMALRKQLAPWLMDSPVKKIKYFLNGMPLRNIEELSLKGEFFVDFEENKSSVSSVGSKSEPTNWFELKPSFYLNDKKVEISDTKKLSQSGLVEVDGSIYYIRSQTKTKELQALNWFWNKAKNDVNQDGNEKTSIKVGRNQTLELFYLRKLGFKVDGGPQWNNMCKIYDDLDKGIISVTPSDKFTGDLKHYQQLGLNWVNFLYQLKLGGVLADDMGLGKTVQALAFFDSLIKKDEMGHCLIVVPTSLTFNWMSECEKFTPHITMKRFQSSCKSEIQEFLDSNKHGIIVTSYGLLHEQVDFFNHNKWNVMLFDEAQYLKNIMAKRTLSARKINANFKLCLTGTPFENHFHELFSVLDLALPGSLGSLKEFKKDYVNKSVVDDEKMDFLKRKIKPVVLRRTKSEILDELPDKIESEVKIPFEEGQREIYKEIAQSWNKEVNQQWTDTHKKQAQMLMLTALLRLRQVCSDPNSIPDVSYVKIPPKINVLIDSIEGIVESGESVLIYTQFLGTLGRIEDLLKKKNINTFILKGQLSQNQREKALRGFTEAEGGAVFLMTLKTGGVGLNLTKANYVFHIEPWWNPAIENQATDRTHRIGQKKTVNVYRYIMADSVEEKIQSLKQIKKKRFDSLFLTNEGSSSKDDDMSNANVNLSTQLTKEDFDFLIET